MDKSEKEPPDKVYWMNYEETFGQGEDWKNSRLLAIEIITTIPGLRDEFVLDQITLGDGQCFTTSVIQQLRRPEVNCRLSPKWQSLSRHLDPRSFKFQVKRFMNTNDHPRIQFLRNNIQNFTGISWEDYWSSRYILKKTTWADHVFIQSTAWCLQLDIVIHQDLQTKPVETISGNIDNEEVPCEGSQIHLGYLVDRHYQSILPSTDFSNSNLVDVEEDEVEEEAKEPNSQVQVPVLSAQIEDKELEQCPVCSKSCKNVLLHIDRAQYCKRNIDDGKYEELKNLSTKKRKEKNKEYQAKFRINNAKKCNEAVAKYRSENPMKAKEDTKKAVAKYRSENPVKAKEHTRTAVAKFRECKDEWDRLRKFREATM